MVSVTSRFAPLEYRRPAGRQVYMCVFPAAAINCSHFLTWLTYKWSECIYSCFGKAAKPKETPEILGKYDCSQLFVSCPLISVSRPSESSTRFDSLPFFARREFAKRIYIWTLKILAILCFLPYFSPSRTSPPLLLRLSLPPWPSHTVFRVLKTEREREISIKVWVSMWACDTFDSNPITSSLCMSRTEFVSNIPIIQLIDQ